ncbi:MAG TPA: hypothetical protein VGH51_02120 [Candidatus Angelobacter sp.]|jgi:hypothetical protein
MPLSDSYRPTKKDETFIWTKFAAVYLHNGPYLTDAEDEFFRLVSEAFRIGTPRKAATIGQARASLQAQVDAKHAQGFKSNPIGRGFLYDKEAYFGHGASYVEDKLEPAHRARILQDYAEHATT